MAMLEGVGIEEVAAVEVGMALDAAANTEAAVMWTRSSP